MVKCGDEPLLVPPPKAAAMAATSKAAPAVGVGVDQEPTYCFRLQEEAPDRDRDSAASTSVYSIYKQRIDQMFDETRSQMSSSACRTTTSYSCCQQEERRRRREEGGSRRPRISNSVQARIEKMFADMAEASGAAAAAGASTAGPPPPAGAGSGRFPVEYLGAVPLRDKVTTLNGLQQPLADLYLGRHHRDGAGGAGWLEICAGGLRVEARGRHWLTAFPSIAVWAAVKFVRRRRGADAQCAFLPLIADPDAVDRDALFRPLPASAGAYAERLGHAPVLAVVMRGGRRQLDCHGFVCERAEDAVVVAAALYQALVAHLQREGAGRHRQPTSRLDGVSYAPAASSVAGSSEAAPSALSAASEPADPAAGREPPPLPAPVRPPRKKRSSVSSASEDGEDAIKVLSSEEIPPPQKSGKKQQSQSKAQQEQTRKLPAPTPPHQQQQHEEQQQKHQQKPQLPQTHQQNQRHQLPQHQQEHQHQRHQSPQQQQHQQQQQQQHQPTASSDPRRSAGPGPDYHDVRRQQRPAPGGDILTKVAIPRSSSFLNAGGPLSRYSGRGGTGGVGVGDCAARGVGGGGGGTLHSSDGGSSPLGFNELFTEFRVHEGLHSTDDILDAIIDAEGMSFNDLKPIYKEFLLKLAFTLTRDELYQRSKSIMRRQRKKQQKHRKGLYAPGSTGGGLKRAFRRSVSKLKPRPGSFEFTSVLFQPRPARASKKCKKPTLVTGKCSSSTSSTFSSRSHKLRTGTNRLPRRLSSRRRAGAPPLKRRPTVSTSEDSDFMCGTDVRLPTRAIRSPAPATAAGNMANNRSSSGYFSCSECSYDSESCTCTSADKCYCSLGGGGGGKVPSARGHKHAPVTSGTTSCDSESCGAGRCCTCGVPRPSMPYRQVSKQMESPDTAWKRNERRTRAALQQQTAARKRMDVYSDVAVRPQYHLPSDFRDFSSTSDLALDYELFTVAKSDRNSVCEDRKVLVVSARDPRGRLLYVGPASCRASSSSDSQRRSHKARAQPRPGNSAGSEALSVKKSAEIAALFSKQALSAPNDEVFYNTLEPPDYYLTARGPKTASNYMASNLENSLGYLP
ncbi:uncharacterized protein LOC126284886 [Schistocerca gregaria]|uniref:uncharacterized protein LOC126284886 n=1 Tax=Schistocerca gregaria TaxID=7010 RepID=UPI00211F1D88|nr:uncharacterized protein LOC126284886 [Schistocerca gregaria]XP_049840097.1 uncharacterized protein LOC126284886 [Schistocerca gregaria]XP_049840098.1 uncharacterized protein LOC126284886 [Schistocerca gregaria]